MDYFRSMENLEIRDATLNDLPTLLNFEQALIAAERPYDPTIKEDPVSYYDIRQFIEAKDVKVVIAVVNDEIVASGYALAKKGRQYLDHSHYGYLGFMYTLPGYRGNGINQKIVQSLKQWCHANGLKEIRLTVYDDNLPAIKAYEKAGFKKHIIEMRIV